MSLSQIVKRFPNGPIPGGVITDNGRKIRPTNPPPAEIGIACHQATFIWLYKAAHGTELFPDLGDIVGAQGVINRLIRFGHPKRVSAKRPPDESDVLIFDEDGQAMHSCIAIRGGNDGLIAGYNQQNWFSGPVPVLQSDFSVYRVNQIKWVERRGIFSSQRAFNNVVDNPVSVKLWAVRGATAVNQI